MKDPLVRFGVAIEASLLRQVDALARERGCTRSELFRDLSRAEVGRAKVRKGVTAVCTLTIVYDHHRTQLTVYLRLLNKPVLSTYGPTADQTWEGADPTRVRTEPGSAWWSRS